VAFVQTSATESEGEGNEEGESGTDGAVIQMNRTLHDRFHATNEASGARVVGSRVRSFQIGQWNDIFPSSDRFSTEMEIASKVVAMANFIGDPTEKSPFSNLVSHAESDARVFDSKLLQLAVQFKWKTVIHLATRRLYFYVIHFAIMCTTLIIDTQQHTGTETCRGLGQHDSGGSDGDGSNVVYPCVFSSRGDCYLHLRLVLNCLYALLMLTNSYVLYEELQEVRAAIAEELDEGGTFLNGLRKFSSDFWNFFDVGSIIMVYGAAIASFTGNPCAVEQVGAMAIVLNSASVIQLMRPFELTGALIQTIITIVYDIRGFWYICVVILMGFTCALTVCEPHNAALTLHDSRVGPFFPLLTVLESMVGAFSLDDYSKTFSVMLFVVFVIFIVIIMLNLLITIIGAQAF
jgi:hypothetical protein